MISHLQANFSVYLTAVAAAIVYGGWAVFANYEHGVHAWAMAGVIQGVYAFISTFCVTQLAKGVFAKCGGGVRGLMTGFTVSFLLMLAIPVGVHFVAGTPDILETILPGLVWGSVYLMGVLILLYVKSLRFTDGN